MSPIYGDAEAARDAVFLMLAGDDVLAGLGFSCDRITVTDSEHPGAEDVERRGLVLHWSTTAYGRGEALRQRVCVVVHGAGASPGVEFAVLDRVGRALTSGAAVCDPLTSITCSTPPVSRSIDGQLVTVRYDVLSFSSSALGSVGATGSAGEAT